MKKILSLLLALVLVLSLAACQEDPDGTIVVHKDMDNLISNAQESSPEKVEAGDIVDEVSENYETYQTTLEDESLNVKVTVDAQVEVPQVDTLSVYRVQQKPIDQNFIDLVWEKLMDSQPVYTGSISYDTGRDGILNEIARARQEIATLEDTRETAWEYMQDSSDNPFKSEEEFLELYNTQITNWQDYIDRLQEEFESLPDSVEPELIPADITLRSVAELYASDPNNDEYDRMNNVIPDGEDLNVHTDGSNGMFTTLHVQNSEDFGGHLCFRASPAGFVGTDPTLIDGATDLIGGLERYDLPLNKNLPEKFLSGRSYYEADTEFVLVPGDEVTLTQEEAIQQAEDCLKELDITDFEFADGGLYTEDGGVSSPDFKLSISQSSYRQYYILQFYRNIDGVLLTQSSGSKFQFGPNDEGVYNKQLWIGECIEFRINDCGIVGFDYYAPLDITETVVEGANLKTFEDVKKTFESMICITSVDSDPQYYETAVNIDRVRLSYSRISERDSFDTGLVVPVWSFEGRAEVGFDGYIEHVNTGSLMAINAVDGSIIDGGLGY